MGLLMAGRNCSQAAHSRVARPWLDVGNVCPNRTSLTHRITADPIDRRIPVTDVISQSPDHEQALAAGIFHLNRCSLAPRVFHLKRHAIVQALAPRIFHPNHYSTEQVFATEGRRPQSPRSCTEDLPSQSPRHWAVSCRRSLLQQTEKSLRRPAGRGLFNVAHFVLSSIQILGPVAYQRRSGRSTNS